MKSYDFRTKILLLVIIFVTTFKIKSQEKDSLTMHHLSGVEIVGKKRPATMLQTTPLQFLDKNSIEQLGLNDLSEAVRRFSGVSVKDYGGVGGLKTVSVRSLGAQHTAVSYDGVTISNAQNGQTDISRFSLDNISEVALSIGQSDDIFQSARLFASAGALRIESLLPHFKDKNYNWKVQMKAGSFGLYNPSFRYEQRIKKNSSFSIMGDWLTAKGDYPFTLYNGKLITKENRLNSDINSYRGEANYYQKIGKGLLKTKLYYFDSERGLPGSVILYTKDANERLWDKNFFGQFHYDVKIDPKWDVKIQMKYNYSWNRYVEKDEKYSGGILDDEYTQKEYYTSFGVKYKLSDKWHFTLVEDAFVNTLVADIPECPNPTRITSLTAIAGQYKSKRIKATASLLATNITEKVEQGETPADRKKLSPAISFSYKLFDDYNFRLRAAYQNTFRVPTFNDLYYARIGNTNLRTEKATQYNLGLTWSCVPIQGLVDFMSLSADGYINKVKDKIVALPTLFIWKMLNMDKVNITGLDINLYTKITLPSKMALQLGGTYAYQHAIDVTNKEAKNYKDQIPYTPPHTLTSSLTFQSSWINASYLLTAVSERYSLPQNKPTNRINGYTEHTFSINRIFSFKKHRLKIQLEAINFTNSNYDVIHYYPMPGRSYRVMMNFIY